MKYYIIVTLILLILAAAFYIELRTVEEVSIIPEGYIPFSECMVHPAGRYGI